MHIFKDIFVIFIIDLRNLSDINIKRKLFKNCVIECVFEYKSIDSV